MGFAFLVNSLDPGIIKFLKVHTNDKEVELTHYLFTILQQMLVCLNSLTTTFLQMQNIVVSLQHYCIELLRLLDYCEQFKPMITGSVHSPGFDNVYNNLNAKLLFRAGIPYWFVHPIHNLGQVQVDHLEEIIKPLNYDKMPKLNLVIIYEGPANSQSNRQPEHNETRG